MRFWISGPRILGHRTGVSFGPGDFRKLRAASSTSSASTAPLRPSAFVYVVSATSGHVKIGVAADPLSRLASLQTGASEPLDLVYACAVQSGNGYAVEQAAHGILWRRRLNGEWFDTTPDLAVAAIAAASHRLGDPIVEIKKDKIAYVLQEAARRGALQPPRTPASIGQVLLKIAASIVIIIFGVIVAVAIQFLFISN